MSDSARDAAGEPRPAGAIATDVAAVTMADSVVTIGFFDGVHRGHRAIIDRALALARAQGVRSAVVTFDRHPMEVVKPGSQPPLLQSTRRRAETLAATGVDLVVMIPFDDELRHLDPEGFVERVLGDRLRPRAVVVGENFRFGHRAAGDVTTLTEIGARRGFAAESVPLTTWEGLVVSSTEIRQRVERGAVAEAADLLGRPFALDGLVVRGDRRGHELGFPTANLSLDPRLVVPARGVYAGHAHVPDGRSVPAVTNVGVNPTFGGQQLRVEPHLLDFDEDLYGCELTVDVRARLRDEQSYEGPEALVAQMHRDIAAARRHLGLPEAG